MIERLAEGIVECILGKVEVAEQADQRRKNSTRLRAVHRLHGLTHLFGGAIRHGDKPRLPSVELKNLCACSSSGQRASMFSQNGPEKYNRWHDSPFRLSRVQFYLRIPIFASSIG